MRQNVWISAALYLSIPMLAVAQTVKIKAETITYTRKGGDVPEHNKSFWIRKPVVVGEKTEEIVAALSYEKAFETPVKRPDSTPATPRSVKSSCGGYATRQGRD